MASWFTVKLDTTGPLLGIVAPVYTVQQVPVEMWLEASEPLSPTHSIYIVDAQGGRHDLIFSLHDNSFYGIYNFAECAPGIATIYAQVQDIVDNISDLAMVTINVSESGSAFLDVSTSVRKIVVIDDTMGIDISMGTRGVSATIDQRVISLSGDTLTIKLTADTRAVVLDGTQEVSD